MVIPFILDIVILQKQKTQSEKGYFLYGDSIHIVTTSVCKGYFFLYGDTDGNGGACT
jgi:fructose-1,6-bisphosphatase